MQSVENQKMMPQFSLLWFNYLTYLLILPSVLGLALSFIKTRQFDRRHKQRENESDDETLLESHHQWLIRTFVILLLMSMASIGTIYMGVGYFLAIATILYWFYRIFRGMISLAAHRSMPGMVAGSVF